MPIAAAVIARMHKLGVAVVAAIGLGVFRQVFFWNSPRSATVDVAMFVVVLGALLLQRRGYERVSGGDLGAYTALRDVRPIPRVLAALPEVRLPRHGLALAGALVAVRRAGAASAPPSWRSPRPWSSSACSPCRSSC